MTQKNSSENTRRDAILAAALPLFLENGYEKTSIRMISQKVGCEVGLVYYYFATKDDLFENALDLYFEEKKGELAEIMEKNKKDTVLFFDTLFSYFEKEAPAFTETFGESVHWTIRLSVRASFASLLEAYVSEAVAVLAHNSRMPYPANIAAKTVSEILVNAALDNDKTYFSANKDELRRIINHILGTDKIASRRRDIPSFLL